MQGRGCFHEKVQGCFQMLWQETEGQRQWKVERLQERRQQREEQQEIVQKQMLQVTCRRIALEIGAVQLPRDDQKHRFGIDSCAAVTVFLKSVADDYPAPNGRQSEELDQRQASFCPIGRGRTALHVRVLHFLL